MSRMITALNHIELAVGDIASAVTTVERVLGHSGTVGEESAAFRLDNVSLDLSLSEGGVEGMIGLAFQVENADAAFLASERRALNPEPPVAFA